MMPLSEARMNDNTTSLSSDFGSSSSATFTACDMLLFRTYRVR